MIGQQQVYQAERWSTAPGLWRSQAWHIIAVKLHGVVRSGTLLVRRRVEQLHAAVVGAHARHAQLLPLEMYLEAGIPLVLYVRDSPHAEMLELPEQSCHAFISTRTAHNRVAPSLKARSHTSNRVIATHPTCVRCLYRMENDPLQQ